MQPRVAAKHDRIACFARRQHGPIVPLVGKPESGERIIPVLDGTVLMRTRNHLKRSVCFVGINRVCKHADGGVLLVLKVVFVLMHAFRHAGFRQLVNALSPFPKFDIRTDERFYHVEEFLIH